MEIKTFGVIGAGTMGDGIAQVAAHSGLRRHPDTMSPSSSWTRA